VGDYLDLNAMNSDDLTKNLVKSGYTVSEGTYNEEPTIEVSHNTVPQFWTTYTPGDEKDKLAAIQFCAEQAVRKIGIPVKGVDIK
jgi:hypothetical protein